MNIADHKKTDQAIEIYATMIKCPRHTKVSRGCIYKNDKPCQCRIEHDSWRGWVKQVIFKQKEWIKWLRNT